MNLYRFYLILPLFLWVISSFFKNEKKAFFVGYSITTFFFYAFKTIHLGVGDSVIYYNLWRSFSTIPLTTDGLAVLLQYDLEPGFLLGSWFLSHAFPDGQFVFVFSAIIYTWGLTHFYSKHCDDYLLSVLMLNSIGLASFFLQAVRQSLAISICLFAIQYCKERKLVKFLLIVFLASMFHSSALLFVIVYFAYGIELNWKALLLVAIGALCFPIILTRITMIANVLMNESYVGGNVEKTTGGVVTMAMYAALICYCLLIRHSAGLSKESIETYTDYSHAFLMFLLAVVFFSMRFYYITVFERASYYFLPFAPIAIGGTYVRYTKQSKRIASALFCIVFIFLAFYKSAGSAPLSSYTFFWINP